MTDKTVHDPIYDSEMHYVAPHEAPPSRPPPVFTVGLLGWLRKNLFSSWLNTLLTFITFGFLSVLLYATFSWALLDAEWNVVTGNMRLLMVGQYHISQLWRVELMALVLVLLCGLSLGAWSQLSRPLFVTIIISVMALVLVPIGATRLPEAPIRVIVSPDHEPNPVFFVGNAGDTVGISIETITNAEALSPTPLRAGFIENTPGLSNSRNVWAEVRAAVTADRLDLSQSDLTFTVRLIDGSGNVLNEAVSTPTSRETRFQAELPTDDWYFVELLRSPESEAGYAWIRLDGVAPMRTHRQAVADRLERYGELPDYDCSGTSECRVQVLRGNLRFEGSRNLGQFLSVQIAPFFNSLALPVFVGVLTASIGVGGGFLAQQRSARVAKLTTRLLVLTWLLLFPISWLVLRGVQDAPLLPEGTLPVVPTALWGGLMLTLVLAFVSILASFPIGVLLALGRTSRLPVVSLVCTGFIELVRGVPLITILFFAKLIIPYFASAITDMDLVIRMMVGLTLFTAAYQAEVVRGGLQIVPHGQQEAAYALGLNPFLTMVFITLPQALRAVIPAMMSQFVSLFKDTTLVSIVGLFELLGMIDFIVSGQQVNRTFQREAYLFVGIIYFVIASGMSMISRRLEETGSGSVRRQA
jgi:general L-amino acid transport system permease protein